MKIGQKRKYIFQDFTTFIRHIENQLPWPKSSLNLFTMPKFHLVSKMKQIQPMDLSTTPTPKENKGENSEENGQKNTQNQIGNYYLVHQIQQLIPTLRILNFHEFI